MITNLAGAPASRLGLAAAPGQDSRCVRRAFEQGINFFFFYGPGCGSFIGKVAGLVRSRREEIIVATGSGARKRRSLLAARRKLVAALHTDVLDVFFAEYISSADQCDLVFGHGGVFDELQQWKRMGWIRYVGATTHDRRLARRLAEDARVDVLMHRFNMAHRKAAREVFPAAVKTRTPVIAFTATRWGTLLEANGRWPGEPPSAADCYRYCLANKAVQIVLTAARSLPELNENLHVLKAPSMSAQERAHWERFGDLIYGGGAGSFETKWS